MEARTPPAIARVWLTGSPLTNGRYTYLFVDGQLAVVRSSAGGFTVMYRH